MVSAVPYATVMFRSVDKLVCIYFAITIAMHYGMVTGELIGNETTYEVKSL